jgi:hypothetical protein
MPSAGAPGAATARFERDVVDGELEPAFGHRADEHADQIRAVEADVGERDSAMR